VQQRLAKYEAQVKRVDQDHAQKVKQWKEREAQFLEEQNQSNEAVDRKKDPYLSKDPDAILDYCDLVLSNSQYHDWMPQEWDMDLNPETPILALTSLGTVGFDELSKSQGPGRIRAQTRIPLFGAGIPVTSQA
jgi:hypothetical protein